MTKDYARKHAARERAAATGEPFTLANRTIFDERRSTTAGRLFADEGVLLLGRLQENRREFVGIDLKRNAHIMIVGETKNLVDDPVVESVISLCGGEKSNASCTVLERFSVRFTDDEWVAHRSLKGMSDEDVLDRYFEAVSDCYQEMMDRQSNNVTTEGQKEPVFLIVRYEALRMIQMMTGHIFSRDLNQLLLAIASIGRVFGVHLIIEAGITGSLIPYTLRSNLNRIDFEVRDNGEQALVFKSDSTPVRVEPAIFHADKKVSGRIVCLDIRL